MHTSIKKISSVHTNKGYLKCQSINTCTQSSNEVITGYTSIMYYSTQLYRSKQQYHVSIHTHTHTHIYIYIYIYIYMYMCVCVYLCVFLHVNSTGKSGYFQIRHISIICKYTNDENVLEISPSR